MDIELRVATVRSDLAHVMKVAYGKRACLAVHAHLDQHGPQRAFAGQFADLRKATSKGTHVTMDARKPPVVLIL